MLQDLSVWARSGSKEEKRIQSPSGLALGAEGPEKHAVQPQTEQVWGRTRRSGRIALAKPCTKPRKTQKKRKLALPGGFREEESIIRGAPAADYLVLRVTVPRSRATSASPSSRLRRCRRRP